MGPHSHRVPLRTLPHPGSALLGLGAPGHAGPPVQTLHRHPEKLLLKDHSRLSKFSEESLERERRGSHGPSGASSSVGFLRVCYLQTLYKT